MLILYYKLPLTYAIFCIQRHNLIAFFYVFFLSLLYCRLFTWIQNQPTSDRWKLSLSVFVSINLPLQLFLSCTHVSNTPAVFHPHWTPALNEVDNWIGTKVCTIRQLYRAKVTDTPFHTYFFFLASYIPSVNFVVSQNFLFFSQLFHHYCFVLLCLTVQFCAWALQVYG